MGGVVNRRSEGSSLGGMKSDDFMYNIYTWLFASWSMGKPWVGGGQEQEQEQEREQDKTKFCPPAPITQGDDADATAADSREDDGGAAPACLSLIARRRGRGGGRSGAAPGGPLLDASILRWGIIIFPFPGGGMHAGESLILGSQPPQNTFGGQPPEFLQPHRTLEKR